MTSSNQTIDITAARTALLELHQRLLQAQRIQAERYGGRMTPGQLLQAATNDPSFSWLSLLFRPIAELDQARADGDTDAAHAALAKVRALLMPLDPETAFGARYLEVMQAHPEVVFAHRDAIAAVSQNDVLPGP